MCAHVHVLQLNDYCTLGRENPYLVVKNSSEIVVAEIKSTLSIFTRDGKSKKHKHLTLSFMGSIHSVPDIVVCDDTSVRAIKMSEVKTKNKKQSKYLLCFVSEDSNNWCNRNTYRGHTHYHSLSGK